VWTPAVSGTSARKAGRPTRENSHSDGSRSRRHRVGAVFLSSDLSSFISGQTIVVDGGVSAKFPYGIPDV